MENTPENRRRIAQMAVESMTFEEMEEALMYEMQNRYKREPGLFDTAVRVLAGEPREWVECEDAHDQGFFFDQNYDHQKPNPLPNAPAES